MPRSRFALGFGRVNLIKKVKVDGEWRFCPAIVDPGRRLSDRVLVKGQIETHSEGRYYLEWREQGRRREPVLSRALVLEQARLKALELESQSNSSENASTSASRLAEAPDPVAPPRQLVIHQFPTLPTLRHVEFPAANLIWRGLESYLQEFVGAAVRSQLASYGLIPQPATSAIEPIKVSAPLTAGAAPNPGHQQPAEPATPDGKTSIAEAIDCYLKDVEPPQREPKTYDEYRLVLAKFRVSCSKRYVEDIERDDLLEFRRQLYSLGNEARTVFNRMGIVLQLLKLHGIERLLKKGDKPKFVRNVREMYQPEDLEALFNACTADEKVLYLFLLLTGERDKEVRYTAWPDIDYSRSCVRVTAKKQLGFKPKDKEEREIPLPSSLLQALREYKTRQSGPNPHNLVFLTASGKPDKKFENKLKRIANRAGLNCRHCVSRHGNRCAEGPHCGKWFLHKFRHTHATTCLESGVSIRTVQEWLGHSDLESTMIYLKYVRRKDIQRLVDSSELAALAAHCSLAGKSRGGQATEAAAIPILSNVIAFKNRVLLRAFDGFWQVL
jgi:integrase/recombinase XerD